MKSKLKQQNAITLVALIITIIVLLILAMVSIALVMNSGIITKSKTAVDKYSQEEIQEQIKLAYSEWQMGQYSGVTEDEPTFVKNKLNSIYGAGTVANVTAENGILTVELTNGKTYTYNVATGKAEYIKPLPNAIPGTPTTENSKYTSDGKTAVIPAGYTVDATQNSIDNGLVISKDGNEWVWIPVSNEDFSAMFGTATDDGWTMSGTDVKTKYKSNGGIINDKYGNPITRGNPGTTDPVTTDRREPDVLNNDSYDKNTTNLSAAGFSSLNDMATKLKDDYKNMIDSVRKNGGFYVGRYELSSAGTKKNQPSLTDTNWYNLYAKCKTLGDESTTYSRMIWGCQWDQVCKFISTAKDANGDTISLTDSTKYGNYSTFDENWKYTYKAQKANTGSNDTWKVNNIYDIAGNCSEWTQEVNKADYRAGCGGSYNGSGDDSPVTYHGNCNPTRGGGLISSRPVLYVK